MKLRRSLLALLALAGCTANAATLPPQPGKDNQPALQAAIDRLSAAGGGTLQLERGVYDVSRPIYLRDNVTVAGRGRETVISSRRLNKRQHWSGTTIYAGNLTPGNFSDDRNEGYPGRPARRTGERELTLDNCSPDDVPETNQFVWLASNDHVRGLGDRVRPEYGEVTLATRIEGCRIELADPIEIPSLQFLIHWSDGSRSLPAPGAPNLPIKNATLRDLALESGQSNALLPSGCYRCTFENLHITGTRRLIGLQGQRNTVFRNITGTFRERGIEVVMYARDVLVDGVNAELRDPVPGGVRPAIRFGEYARDNTIRNVTLRLGEGYVGRDKLRFGISGQNRLENIVMIVPRPDRVPLYRFSWEKVRPTHDRLLPEGTVLRDVRLCYGGTTDCDPITEMQ